MRFKNIYEKVMSNNLFSKIGIYFMGQGLIGLINFMLVPIYSRSLPPDEFGKIAIIMIFIPIASSIMKIGLEQSFSIRFYKENQLGRIKSIYTVYSLYCMVSFFLIIVSTINLEWINQILLLDFNSSELIKINIILITTLFTQFLFNLLKIEQKAKNYVKAVVSFTLLRVILLIYLIVYLNQGYVSYLNASVLANILYTILSFIYVLRNYNIKKFKINRYITINLIKIGLPIVPGLIFSRILTSGDQYILKYYDMLKVVGIYAMGYKFAGAFSNFIITPFTYATSPMAMKKGNNDINNYKKYMKIVVENFVVGLYILVLFLYVFLYQVYNLIIDIQYHEGYNIIWIVIISLIIWGTAQTMGRTIVLKEQTHKTLMLTATAAIINIVLNLILVPGYNMYGAAWATLISYTIVAILYYIYSQRLIKIVYNFSKIFKASIIFGLALYLEEMINYIDANVILLMSIKFILSTLVTYLFLKFKILDLSFVRRETNA